MLAMAVVMMLASAASASASGPVWRIDAVANTTAAPGQVSRILAQVTNIGDAATDGSEIAVTVTLPGGLVGDNAGGGGFSCPTAAGASMFTCTTTDTIGTHEERQITLDVGVDPGAEGLATATLSVTGGGTAETASTSVVTRMTSAIPDFGLATFDGAVTADGAGTPFTQAGGHPYAVSTSIDFNTITNPNPFIGMLWPVAAPKDVLVDLPPGLVGNPTAAAECTTGELANIGAKPLCAPASQVGVAMVRLNSLIGGVVLGPVPVYNMVPPPYEPARFGFNIAGTVVSLDASVRSNTDYGLSVNAPDISEGLAIAGTSLTFWGVPSESSHDAERACAGEIPPASGGPTCAAGTSPHAFLRIPTSCSSPGTGVLTSAYADSWADPARQDAFGRPDQSDPRWTTASFTSHLPPGYPRASVDWGPPQGPTGCDNVPFNPLLDGQPVISKASSPTGFVFDLSLPQSDDPGSIGESDLKKAVVTLPAGVRVSPSSADGLAGCSSAQIALRSTADATCPDASKLGSMEIDSPLLDVPLIGSIYLARPFDNPFGSLLAVYLVASAKGVVIKVPGEVRTDPSTGQITATFDNNPQLPFTRVHMVFNGGPRAPLTLPGTCGSHTTRAVLTGWNGKVVNTTSTFTVSGDGHGSPCPSPKFAPGFTAGTQNPIAGGYSPFGLQLTRTDDDGEFSALSSLSLPKGLLANVASVTTRCTIEQADAHSCPTASHIGEVTAGAGAGTSPFYVGGDVYLTGPYKGNPFGIAVIVHAQAGPFDLGYVVVKGAIQIHDDGSVTVATDPFPTILQGIPLQIRDVRVNLDRPRFMFNPTSCNPMSIDGRVVSTDNQQAGVSSRFQVGECANLTFKPSFTVSTAGKTSKANGASLHVHVGTHEGPTSAGAPGESNIAKVDVQLPVVLPARLPTLQKACTAAQFGADPAGCPVGSFVGTAIAHTPILSSPLSGPAILVSHGGQAFPDLVLVLQGEGVRINLTGHTQIKKGITYNHFETVPDAPVSSFDLTLPAGPHGVLTTDVPGRNLCATTRTVTVTKRVTRRVHGHTRRVTVKAKKAVAAPLLMPTTMTAQNGAVIHQTTKIAVTGCAKVKAKAKAKQAKARGLLHKH
jgi:hypothetical protein